MQNGTHPSRGPQSWLLISLICLGTELTTITVDGDGWMNTASFGFVVLGLFYAGNRPPTLRTRFTAQMPSPYLSVATSGTLQAMSSPKDRRPFDEWYSRRSSAWTQAALPFIKVLLTSSSTGCEHRTIFLARFYAVFGISIYGRKRMRRPLPDSQPDHARYD